jgi:hypothetical protein
VTHIHHVGLALGIKVGQGVVRGAHGKTVKKGVQKIDKMRASYGAREGLEPL